MLYLFHGTDTERVRTKAFAFVAAARAKEPNLTYLRIANEELSPEALADAAGAHSLFTKRLLILLDDPYPRTPQANTGDAQESEPLGNVKHSQEMLDDYVEALAASENVIVLLAPKLPSAKAKNIEKHTTKTYCLDAPAHGEAARGFNSALVNALASRSREKLWLEVVRALRAGDAPEQIHGLLHWKARDLMKKSATGGSQEARALSLALLALLMDSRRKGLDLSKSLERFALSI